VEPVERCYVGIEATGLAQFRATADIELLLETRVSGYLRARAEGICSTRAAGRPSKHGPGCPKALQGAVTYPLVAPVPDAGREAKLFKTAPTCEFRSS
jgi:hypothetical protein